MEYYLDILDQHWIYIKCHVCSFVAYWFNVDKGPQIIPMLIKNNWWKTLVDSCLKYIQSKYESIARIDFLAHLESILPKFHGLHQGSLMSSN